MTLAPRVSILLPVHNAAGTIASALASLQRQTERSWHCIAVDDGSDDATPGLLAAAARGDSRISVVTTAPQGVIGALTEGLRHCAAPAIARMDADDVMRRDRLAVQLARLDADPSLAAVGCHVRLFPRERMSPRLRAYEAWLNGMCTPEDVARDLFVECPIAHPTLVMRRGMAELGYQDHGWPEDYDLMLRAHARGLRIGVVPRRLLAWRDRPDRASRTDVRYALDRFTACKAHYLARGFLAATDDYILWGYGDTGRTLRRALLVHGKRPRAIIEVKPSRIGQRIHGAPVVPVEALPGMRGWPLVVSVAHAGPRMEIRRALADARFVEGRDFVCAA